MPIDKPEATADVNTRRSFLTRAALGGALVAAAGPLRSVLPAGAQDPETTGEAPIGPAPTGTAPALEDAPYLLLGAQLEDAAVHVYEAALSDRGSLAEEVATALAQFQKNHMEARDALVSLMLEEISSIERTPNETVLALAAGIGGDVNAGLRVLAQMEQDLAATHLWAIGGLEDPITAKNAAQILAVESEQAVWLTRLAQGDLGSMFPAEVTTDGAFTEAHSSAVAQIEQAAAEAEAAEAGDTPEDGSAPPATSDDVGGEQGTDTTDGTESIDGADAQAQTEESDN